MSSSATQVEYELNEGCLWIRMSNGRYWKLRQNGRVQRWKRDLFRYRIPVKAGMYVYDAITQDDTIGTYDSNYKFIACNGDANSRENVEARKYGPRL